MIQYLYTYCEVTSVSVVLSAFKIGGNRDARINKNPIFSNLQFSKRDNTIIMQCRN